jgi:TolA-binding protein
VKPAQLIALGLGLGLGLGLAQAKRARVERAPRDPKAYLEEMEKKGLIDHTTGTPERLSAEVRAADEELLGGRTQAAAARLYAVVEGPRFAELADSDDFQDAEYRLGIALHRGGGDESAKRYLERSLRRGKTGPFYEASLRAYVDVCLDARTAHACSETLDKIGAEDLNQEMAYLRGRAAFDADDRQGAEDELRRVTPKSRFYSSAIYLRGVLRVKQADWKGAQDAFCVIADVKEGDTIRFYIDGRYYALKDLARLALGRVAHEEGRYDDAFYHYFLIPQDSKKLPEALFEAAWSSLQRKEYDLGARLVDELMKQFPHTPKAVEARALRATLQVKTCRFAEAEKGFDAILSEYEPLERAIERAIADPVARRALALRVLDEGSPASPQPNQGEAQRRDVDTVMAELLELDPKFFRLHQISRGLAKEAEDAAHVEDAWHDLMSGLTKTNIQASSARAIDPASLYEQVGELRHEIARARSEARASRGVDELKQTLTQLETRRAQLEATLEKVVDSEGSQAEGQGLVAFAEADAAHAARLRARAAKLATRIDEARSELVKEALVDLRQRIDSTLRTARLGKIDAVVGQKRKLEKQIEDLAAGRFPPEIFGRLHIEGLIGDDEEYWPPERELWADEYENYK